MKKALYRIRNLDFWGIRYKSSKSKRLENVEEISDIIKQQATQENNPTKVRSSALTLLAQQENNSEFTPFGLAIQEKSLWQRQDYTDCLK